MPFGRFCLRLRSPRPLAKSVVACLFCVVVIAPLLRISPLLPLSYTAGVGRQNAPLKKDELVRRVRQFQSLGDKYFVKWRDFCDNHLGRRRDPLRHDPETLKAFLATAHPLVRLFAKLQHDDKNFNTKWHEYCDMTFKGKGYDPFGYTTEVQLEFLALCDIRPPPGVLDAVSDLDAEKIQMIKRLKGYTISGGRSAWAEWYEFCKENGEHGEVDPARVDKDSLRSFLVQHGVNVPDLAKMRPLVEAVRRFNFENKDAWVAFCDEHLNGKYDPSMADVETLQAYAAEQSIEVDYESS